MRDKIVFITGASSGIGRETALRFATAGARLVLSCNRRREEGEEVARVCAAAGAGGVMLVRFDTTDETAIEQVLAEVTARHPRLHVLVNNAGVGFVKPFAETTLAEIEQQLRTNLEGLIKLTKFFLPHVSETLVNIGSMLSQEPIADMAAYCASKFGVRGFTRALALERPDLRIALVNPDLTATPLTAFHGRPAAVVADVIFRTVAGEIPFAAGGDVNVWEQ